MEIKHIEEKRRLLKMSMDSLATAIGVVRKTYNNWLDSGSIPDKYYDAAARAVGLTPGREEAKPLPIIPADPNGKNIPFYDVEVFATISPAMGDVVALRPDTFIRIPMFNQGQFAVQVTGHSMKPYISHSDWVVIRKITDRSEIIYGEPYLVVTKSDNLKTVKFLKQGDTDETYWLVPYNVEQFEPQEIKKSSVLELYRVIGVFKSV